MKFTSFPKYISGDSAADLFQMELINKMEFNKHHKVIYCMINECSTYKISTNIANNSYRPHQCTCCMSCINLFYDKTKWPLTD